MADFDTLDKDAQKLMKGIMADLARAAALGLIPQDGAKISARGEFIVDESNVEADENKKQRGYRHKEYPKTVHAWGPDPVTGEEGPLSLTVRNAAEEANAEKAGWSAAPVHGPAGRLEGGVVVTPAEDVAEVREFAAPGQVQPFDAQPQTGSKAKTAPAPKVTGSKAKTAKKK